jgi:eukaryotic-like serine/threonine-protein kinase
VNAGDAMQLTAAEWTRIEALFPMAMEMDGAARAQFLERECAREPRVRAELEAMLAALDGDDGLLDAPVGLTSTETLPEPTAAELAPGTRLGPWKIRSLIGHGGMGEVFLAERADGAYAMQAAIKLLKRELYSYANAQRFLRERRVLAHLSHPNIARVLDAGTTDDGRPYLVMEYAGGTRITDHARARDLGPREAARLLLAVADAMAEAHRHGVVHRDLKPANVMVADDGQVKVLDFGIAKLLDEDDAATPGVMPMTPAFAAPEQLLGRPLAPAADVYALGVMLFQLLTQRLPHAREGMPLPVIAAGLHAETIEAPSVVLGRATEMPEPARGRAAALRGDLDAIVLKTLQREPQQRYADAQALADDLGRFLDDRPVLALLPSWRARAGQFVRRYPALVATTLVIGLALIATTGLALREAHLAQAALLSCPVPPPPAE